MDIISHASAKPSHYSKDAIYYDQFNEKNSKVANCTVVKILKKMGVRSVLDLSCGTGSQVFWLHKRGFDVVGSDINSNMLQVAKEKAKKEKLNIQFIKGDMRTKKIGQFDAVITIFNAIGHLTKFDFMRAMQNIHKNLKDGGLFLFDIFNLNYLIKDNNITKLTIDWQNNTGNMKLRDIQYSTINREGILASFTISMIQKGNNAPRISRNSQTLQIYSAKQLKQMLKENGFKALQVCEMDGSKFVDHRSERILMLAKKIS